MPDWLREIVTGGIGVLVTAVILGYWRSRGVARRKAALREGRSTSFEAFIRGSTAPYPRRWRYGWVFVNLEGATWKPRFSLRRRPIPLPAGATVEMLRRPAGFLENLATNPNCHIVVARAGDARLELAIVTSDVPTALQSLTGPGANWTSAYQFASMSM